MKLSGRLKSPRSQKYSLVDGSILPDQSIFDSIKPRLRSGKRAGQLPARSLPTTSIAPTVQQPPVKQNTRTTTPGTRPVGTAPPLGGGPVAPRPAAGTVPQTKPISGTVNGAQKIAGANTTASTQKPAEITTFPSYIRSWYPSRKTVLRTVAGVTLATVALGGLGWYLENSRDSTVLPTTAGQSASSNLHDWSQSLRLSDPDTMPSSIPFPLRVPISPPTAPLDSSTQYESNYDWRFYRPSDFGSYSRTGSHTPYYRHTGAYSDRPRPGSPSFSHPSYTSNARFDHAPYGNTEYTQSYDSGMADTVLSTLGSGAKAGWAVVADNAPGVADFIGKTVGTGASYVGTGASAVLGEIGNVVTFLGSGRGESKNAS